MEAKRRKKHLTSARACRRYLADILYRMDANELDAAKGAKMGYIIGIILKSIELTEIETRLCELERIANNGKDRAGAYYTN